ncbi:MAG TPA: HlyD family efflux transporter periplasmic adaptor subunit [Candidatus Angelobacter sp.]
MSPPQEPAPARRPKRYLWWIAAAAVLAVLLLAQWARPSRRTPVGEGVQRTSVVERKTFLRSLRFHGIVEAVESHGVSAPRLSGEGMNQLIITKLIKSGSVVHQGDVLVEFDRQGQERVVLDKQAEYRDLEGQIVKKKADQAAARAADETELKQGEDAQKNAELEVKKNEIVSQIDAEKNLQNLDQARATLKQLHETFDLKRRAATAELKILEIQRDRAQMAMRWAQNNMQKMVVRSSVEGIAVVSSMWKGGSMSEVQEGDQVRAGTSLLQVVDPSRMQVRSRVNQADISLLADGQNVRVGLDAYPGLSFAGKVEGLAAVVQTSAFNRKARVGTALFSIHGTDPSLLPDLSAAVDVELMRRPDVLVLPRDAIVEEAGSSFVFVRTGSGYEKKQVKLGEANDTEQVVVSGVEKGAVVLRNPGAS